MEVLQKTSLFKIYEHIEGKLSEHSLKAGQPYPSHSQWRIVFREKHHHTDIASH